MRAGEDGRVRVPLIVGGGLAVLVAIIIGVVVLTSSAPADVTIYTARSHYGDEAPFDEYADANQQELKLFGGSASELYERLKNEGDSTDADMLITVDVANLWRAKEEGLLQPVDSPAVQQAVPAEFRDPDNQWFGVTVRARTVMRSTERVPEDAVDSYEDLGDPRFKGRVCLRSGTSEYNVSFVADRLAKDGDDETRALLESWMANEPEILGSDVDVLQAIKAGRCDIGLTNSYYLGRELKKDAGFPVAPVWVDQDGRGTHVNISGIGIVKGAKHRANAVKLLEHLVQPEQQAAFSQANHEFAVDEGIEPTEQIAKFGDFKRDPIDVERAGERLDDALQMMASVGWN
jgi:iron(III) transport system substrate-binding protein